MGAVIQQRCQDAWQPLAFFSRKLSPAQQNYSAYDRELLAIYEAVRHFRHMLEARHFTILTDHKPITFAFQQKRDNCSPRQFNHLDYISQFTTDIRHISGRDNIIADTLSRVEYVASLATPEALAAAQDDDELNTLLSGTTALQLQRIHIPGTAVTLYCDTAGVKPRPYVPSPLRFQVFDSLASVTQESRLRRSSSPNASCGQPFKNTATLGPELAKPTSAPKCPATLPLPLATFPTQLLVFFISTSTLSIPYHPRQDFNTASLQWTASLAGRKPSLLLTSPQKQYHVPFSGWMSPFGCPQTITTDQGRQFESQLFHCLAKICGIHLCRTTLHHPAANGLVERFHRTMKAAIMCYADEQWTEALPLVHLGMRTVYKDDLETSVAELVYSEPHRIPGEILAPTTPTVEPAYFIQQLRRLMSQLRPVPAARHASPATFIHRDLKDATRLPATGRSTPRVGSSLQRSAQGHHTHGSDIPALRSWQACQCQQTGSNRHTQSTRQSEGFPLPDHN
jgi:cleavage and polyadenylation specificity factor subunit 1